MHAPCVAQSFGLCRAAYMMFGHFGRCGSQLDLIRRLASVDYVAPSGIAR